MDPDVLAALAQTGSVALVTAAVTDAWEDVRHKIARWFGRGQSDAATLQTLDRTREELATAAPCDLDAAQKELARDWVVRFLDLARRYPDAAGELEALVRSIQALQPAGPTSTGDYSVAAGHDVTISAGGGGLAAGVIHGGVTPPGPTMPGPVREQGPAS